MRSEPAGATATIDEAIEDCVLTRRDFYLGLWAGRKLGLADSALQSYARSVVEADHKAPGSGAIVHKIERDFKARGCRVTRVEIERELHRLDADAHRQFLVSD